MKVENGTRTRKLCNGEGKQGETKPRPGEEVTWVSWKKGRRERQKGQFERESRREFEGEEERKGGNEPELGQDGVDVVEGCVDLGSDLRRKEEG